MKKLCVLTVLLALLSGCKVGPNYVPPETPVCDEWIAPEADDEETPDVEWWQKLADPLLSRLINDAVTFNNDLKVAAANVVQARALIQVSAADLFPRIGTALNALHTHLSRNGFVDLISIPDTIPNAAPRIPQNINLYSALIDASWEIDIFGKTQRAIENSRATYQAQIEQRSDVLISIIAEVARDYVQLRSSQKNWELVNSNIELLERNVGLMRNRLKSGIVNSLDLQRLEAELAVAMGGSPPIVAQIYQSIYAISVLTGVPPETLLCELLPSQPLPEPPCELELGVRSDILRRRPDIRKAERELAAATANVGVAVASFYPSFTLFGFFGLQSVTWHKLFKPDSKTWLYAGTLNIPIFEGGRLIGNLKATEAATVAAAMTYQQTVLKALEEAEGALVAYTQDQLAAEQQQDAVRKVREVSRLSNNRLQAGLINLTDWLDAERQLISSEQSLLTTQTQVLLDMIRLYKALGGGWEAYCCEKQDCEKKYRCTNSN